jgi:hypothetical protein
MPLLMRKGRMVDQRSTWTLKFMIVECSLLREPS